MNINTFQFDQFLTGLILEFNLKEKECLQILMNYLPIMNLKHTKTFLNGSDLYVKEETLVTNF